MDTAVGVGCGGVCRFPLPPHSSAVHFIQVVYGAGSSQLDCGLFDKALGYTHTHTHTPSDSFVFTSTPPGPSSSSSLPQLSYILVITCKRMDLHNMPHTLH